MRLSSFKQPDKVMADRQMAKEAKNGRPKPVVKELGVLMCVILTARKIQLQHHGQPRVETRACP